ncbi:MAG: fibronectin type III domain-containing protein [Melioribacteraceae bacterium]|nr:fibronectin type III domain-containing protein [Melioribacteraceae bacterium]
MKIKWTILMLLILIGYNINNAQPTLTFPTNGAAGISLSSITFDWSDYSFENDGSSEDDYYRVKIGISSGGNDFYHSPPSSVTSSQENINLASAQNNTTYYWSVDVYDDGILMSSSSEFTFITILGPPTTTAATAITGTSFSANWTAHTNGGATSYILRVGTTPNGTDIINDSNVGNVLIYSVTGLSSGTTYYYSVKANDGTYTSVASNETNVTTLSTPTPSLSTPANTLTGVPIQPTFTWTWTGSGSVEYQIQISTINTFATTVFDSTFATATTVTLVEARKLLNNTNYYWRVRAKQGSNYSSWSTTYSFKTIPVVTILPINPINTSTNVEFNPTYFSFQSLNGNGTLTYVIQYYQKATQPTLAEWDGANTIILTNLLSQLPYAQNLLANKKYYWRVVVKNSSNEIISYSGIYYFTTKSGAFTPYLSYPIGGMPVYTNTPTFYWYIGTNNLTNLNFTLIIATNNTFTTGVDSIVNINALEKLWTNTALTTGQTYYWKVLCWYKKGVAGEQQVLSSSSSSFVVQGNGFATTPYLAYPTGGLTIYTTTPTLYWYTGASTAGVVFDVYIKLSTSGSYTQVADNITDLYLDMSGNPFTLAAGSTYNWYVVAQGTNGNFNSSVGSFVVSSSLGTGSPIASWPVGNPYVYSLTPTLYWYLYGNLGDIDHYIIKYSSTTPTGLTWWNTNGTVLSSSVLNSSTYWDDWTGHTLTAGTTYYWAIAGRNSLNIVITPWSQGSFTISTSTTAVDVYLSAPIGGLTVFTLTPTLYWYATGNISSITSYTLQYSNTAGFVSGPSPAYTQTINGITDNFYTLPSNNDNAGATIYWKVTAHYTGGGSSTSATGNFVIDPGASSVVPLVGSPINNVQLKTTTATLSWAIPAQSKSSLTYTLEYSDNNNFSNSKVVNDLKQNFYTVTGLKDNTTYYWRVKSNAGNNSSLYSNVGQFITNAKVTAVEDISIPTEYALEQNYPNPFNPSTLIKYSLPENTFVTIKIYDMLGKEIKTLVSKESAAGNYSIEWKGDDNFGNKVSTGTYIYRISAGNFVAVKKMLLIK